MASRGPSMLEFLNQIVLRPSQVRQFQNLYQSGPLPVHLKGPSDIKTYKLVMWGCIAGFGITSYEFYQMARGYKKREPVSSE